MTKIQKSSFFLFIKLQKLRKLLSFYCKHQNFMQQTLLFDCKIKNQTYLSVTITVLLNWHNCWIKLLNWTSFGRSWIQVKLLGMNIYHARTSKLISNSLSFEQCLVHFSAQSTGLAKSANQDGAKVWTKGC